MKQQTAARSTSGRRSSSNAISLLKADHRMVEELFSQIESSRNAEEIAELLVAVQTALSVHARIEEEVFYPAIREAIGGDRDGADLLNEAAIEHGSLKHCMVDISTTSDNDQFYRARIKVLKEYVNHHVKEEEEKLMPLAEASGVDLDALGSVLAERRETLLAALEPNGESAMRARRAGPSSGEQRSRH